MHGSYVCILHEDLWNASREWSDAQVAVNAVIPTLDAFEHACGIEFHTSMGHAGLYVYYVYDAHKLMSATLRYGWRVTPYTT